MKHGTQWKISFWKQVHTQNWSLFTRLWVHQRTKWSEKAILGKGQKIGALWCLYLHHVCFLNLKRRRKKNVLLLQSFDSKTGLQPTEVSDLLLYLLTKNLWIVLFSFWPVNFITLKQVFETFDTKTTFNCNFKRSIKNLFSFSTQACPIPQKLSISHKHT